MLLCLIILVLTVFVFRFHQETYFRQTHNGFFKTKLDLGLNGEYLTYKELRPFEKKGAKFIFNCYLPTENGETTEADVIMLFNSGIYVFESKNYSGWIFGSEKSRTWTQSLPQGKGKSRKEHFLNPIVQNKLHIKWIKALVGDDIVIHSVVVFSKRCELKNKEVLSCNTPVIKRNLLLSEVVKINKGNENAIDNSEITRLFDLLYPLSQVGDEVKAKHIADIEKKLNSKDNTDYEQSSNESISASDKAKTEAIKAEANDVCPRCGGRLIIRTATKGEHAGKQFYGCENFPKCRFTKKV